MLHAQPLQAKSDAPVGKARDLSASIRASHVTRPNTMPAPGPGAGSRRDLVCGQLRQHTSQLYACHEHLLASLITMPSLCYFLAFKHIMVMISCVMVMFKRPGVGMGIRTTPPFRIISLVPGGPADRSQAVQVVPAPTHKQLDKERIDCLSN